MKNLKHFTVLKIEFKSNADKMPLKAFTSF